MDRTPASLAARCPCAVRVRRKNFAPPESVCISNDRLQFFKCVLTRLRIVAF